MTLGKRLRRAAGAWLIAWALVSALAGGAGPAARTSRQPAAAQKRAVLAQRVLERLPSRHDGLLLARCLLLDALPLLSPW